MTAEFSTIVDSADFTARGWIMVWPGPGSNQSNLYYPTQSAQFGNFSLPCFFFDSSTNVYAVALYYNDPYGNSTLFFQDTPFEENGDFSMVPGRLQAELTWALNELVPDPGGA